MWIGLNDKAIDNQFEWTDGTSPSYTKWNEDAPDIGNNNLNCVQLNSEQEGIWCHMECSEETDFVCKRRTLCDESLSYFDGHCYFHNTFSTTWEWAEYSCNILHGHLISIHSETENNFIKLLVGERKVCSHIYSALKFCSSFKVLPVPIDFDQKP